VIAGNVAAGDRQRGVQRPGKCEIVRARLRIEREIAGVDDEVGPCRVDVLADAMKIVGEFLQATREMGIGNLRQAKFGNALFLSGPIIIVRT